MGFTVRYDLFCCSMSVVPCRMSVFAIIVFVLNNRQLTMDNVLTIPDLINHIWMPEDFATGHRGAYRNTHHTMQVEALPGKK
jgi:hypothetical protein